MKRIVLLQHGESVWWREHRFVGWTDVDLTEAGHSAAAAAGARLRAGGYEFDAAYTSLLKRSIRSLWIVLDALDQMWVPVHRNWRLNEQHYGALQGRTDDDVAAEFGAESVALWRHGYDARPPALSTGDPRWPGHDRRYRSIWRKELPLTESLQDTVARVVPYWEHVVAPEVSSGRRVLLVAHGNSIRALIMYLDRLSPEQVLRVRIPVGVPIAYELGASLAGERRCLVGGDGREEPWDPLT
ncbi:MAG: 2,3-diphosphoglycerate-dependent phosphoglycerate mutase [Phycisphaerales bacterium]|nr:2,3-diphosphoglycerate-dependent phosphoglycerate mutase [Phycisphaerales bacterium]